MYFRQIFEENLAQYTYLIGCQKTGEAIVIDPMRDIERYVEIAASEDLKIVAVTETHIHADYLSGAREFAEQYGVKLYLSDEGDADWKYFWAKDSSYDVTFLKHEDTFDIGNIQLKALHTPGHTPEHMSFLVTDFGGGASVPMGIASGDFVFVGDLGRPDLLESAAGQVGAREPAARTLFHSLDQFMALPDYMQVWPGHGAGSACGKALGAVPESTVGYEKMFNASIAAAEHGEQAFVDSILSGQPEPPMYFARMKRDNKMGPNVLGRLPNPAKVTSKDLVAAASKESNVVIDTRHDRVAFMDAHLAGSFYAPLDKSFSTIAGSYVEEHQDIFLIVDSAESVYQAVLNLIRIGLDNVVGFVVWDEIKDQIDTVSTPSIQAEQMEDIRTKDGVAILDVRRLTEYEELHVPDAINIAHTRLHLRKSEVPTDKKLYVHCRTGARSAAASAYLEAQGFDVVYVDGLFENWTTRELEASGV